MKRLALFTALACLPAAAFAQVALTGAVVRLKAGDPSQAYVLGTLTSPAADSIVGVSSPAAKMGHIHLTRRGKLGSMRTITEIPLPAGQTRTLTVYGYHAMLTGLAAPLKPGTTIPVTLRFDSAEPVTASFPVTTR